MQLLKMFHKTSKISGLVLYLLFIMLLCLLCLCIIVYFSEERFSGPNDDFKDRERRNNYSSFSWCCYFGGYIKKLINKIREIYNSEEIKSINKLF